MFGPVTMENTDYTCPTALVNITLEVYLPGLFPHDKSEDEQPPDSSHTLDNEL